MFNQEFLTAYLKQAPIPLALERVAECQILSAQEFKGPILDIGCGEGMFAQCLFSTPIDTGIDPNQKELERAATYQSYQELIACSGDNIPKNDGSYQTIFSNSVLEHIPDIEAVIAECHRLLADDGVFYVTIPTNYFEQYTWTYQVLSALRLTGLAKRYASFFNQFWRHYHCYTIDQWQQLFAKHGFDVAEQIEYGSKTFCLLNTFLTPFSLFSFLTKKRTNRWILWPKWRNFTARCYAKLLSGLQPSLALKPGQAGGLIFFKLKKS